MLVRLVRFLKSLLLLYVGVSYLARTPKPLLKSDTITSKHVSVAISYNHPLIALNILPIMQILGYPDNYNAISELYTLALAEGVTPAILLFTNGTLILGAPLETVKGFADRSSGKHKNWVRVLEGDWPAAHALYLDAVPTPGLVAAISGQSGINVASGLYLGEPPTHGNAGDYWSAVAEITSLGGSGVCTVVSDFAPFLSRNETLQRLDDFQLTVLIKGAVNQTKADSHDDAHSGEANTSNIINENGPSSQKRFLLMTDTKRLAKLLYCLKKSGKGALVIPKHSANLLPSSEFHTLEKGGKISWNISTISNEILTTLRTQDLQGTSAGQYAWEAFGKAVCGKNKERILDQMRQSVHVAADIARCATYNTHGLRGYISAFFNLVAYTAYGRDDLDRMPFSCRRLPLYDIAVAFIRNPLLVTLSSAYHMYFLSDWSSLLFGLGQWLSYGLIINGILGVCTFR